MRIRQLINKTISLFLVDIDGVILRGKAPIIGSSEAIKELRINGAKIIFVTNNSTKSRIEHAKNLSNHGIPVIVDDIISTSYCAAKYAKENELKSAYVVGEEGLKEELERANIQVLSEHAKKVDAVIVGMDRTLTYTKLATAHRLITSGATFIATNTDATYPIENGEAPGAGAMVAAIQTTVGKPPIILGKPNPFMLNLALNETRISVDNCAVVGDRPETDIAMANKGGCIGILVLTGVSASSDPLDYFEDNRPALIYESLADLARRYH